MLRLRLIIRWTVLAAILTILVGTFCAQWQTVVSGSMAVTLVGPHHRITCDDCGYVFSCEADTAAERAACPNCGYPTAIPSRQNSGSQLLVDRTAFEWRNPRRWEVIVFDSPATPGTPVVKRTVGLPGEAIEIRDGEVFANGQIVRKSLDVARAMAVLVHDTAFQPDRQSSLPPHWVASSESNWHSEAGRFILSLPPDFGELRRTGEGRGEGPKSDASTPIDWLEYQHWQRLPNHLDKTEPIPIRDEDSYNAGNSRRLNDVFDLLLVSRLTAAGPGQLFWRATDGRQWFQVLLDPAQGRLELSREGEPLQSVTLPAPLLTRETVVEFALIDHCVIFALDGVVQLEHAYEPDNSPRRPTSRPIAIGARGLSVQIARLQLFRDVYYTDPPLGTPRNAQPLDADEYFVLGDNSPVSDDSRTWRPAAALPARCLIGKPLGIR